MIDTDCFKDLNLFGPDNTPTPDLMIDAEPEPEKKSCFPFRRKVLIFILILLIIAQCG
jgi:G protein-coupled receptor kinase